MNVYIILFFFFFKTDKYNIRDIIVVYFSIIALKYVINHLSFTVSGRFRVELRRIVGLRKLFLQFGLGQLQTYLCIILDAGRIRILCSPLNTIRLFHFYKIKNRLYRYYIKT